MFAELIPYFVCGASIGGVALFLILMVHMLAELLAQIDDEEGTR